MSVGADMSDSAASLRKDSASISDKGPHKAGD